MQSSETTRLNHLSFQKIYDVARAYNQAFVLVEVNDIGEQVANALQYDMEYDNLIMASMRGRAGQILGGGFSGGRGSVGCENNKGSEEDRLFKSKTTCRG